MNIHEYQAKALFREYGIPVPCGGVARNPAEAAEVAGRLDGGRVAVKAQIHAGARGKAGGVILADTAQAAADAAEKLLGQRLVTLQTGPAGLPVEAVWVEAVTQVARELYLSLLVDRASERLMVIASARGGMDIEAVAARDPRALRSTLIDPAAGLMPYQGRELGFELGLNAAQVQSLGKMLDGLYRLFIDKDCSQIEINPLVLTEAGELTALDAKIVFDDNALFLHPEVVALRDPAQTDEREFIAEQHGLSYISLDGDIGCMVNGAGLAMATLDLIKLHGGVPANFLDVGGGATAERVEAAFRLILSDPKVRAVLVNIFGGIVRCDLIAAGVIQAVREVHVGVPVVVRLEGTNAEEGRRLLAESGFDLIPAQDLTDAAKRAVAAAGA